MQGGEESVKSGWRIATVKRVLDFTLHGLGSDR